MLPHRSQQQCFPEFAFHLFGPFDRRNGHLEPDLCWPWLDDLGLTVEGRSYRPETPEEEQIRAELEQMGMGIRHFLAQRHPGSELSALERRYREKHPASEFFSPSRLENIWTEYRYRNLPIPPIDVYRLPADVLAFYRPFHLRPHGEWGIYILIDRLLPYAEHLYRRHSSELQTFNASTLLGCMLFEIFHHEFYHHLVESTATIMEIVLAGVGHPTRLYLDYRAHQYEAVFGAHPHKPLEEALANAYAHNSLSFVDSVNPSYQTVLGKTYQRILKQCWQREPPGYRYAEAYTKDLHLSGTASLLAMLLSAPQVDIPSVALLAHRVMPMGHMALMQKATIPTYLVGTDNTLEAFLDLVPAPNETYVKLYWPGDSSMLTTYLAERRREEAEAAEKARAQAKPTATPNTTEE